MDRYFDRLDDRWRELPVRKQHKYTLYFFLGYLMLTAGVIAKVWYDTGKSEKDMKIRHIENPVLRKEKALQACRTHYQPFLKIRFMKENENKKTVVRVTEGNPKETANVLQDRTQSKADKLKKPLIFGLMGIVFIGCMYLIFKPSKDKNEIESLGLNDAVPQATEAGLQSDKQKAYEQEMLEQKDKENEMP